MSDRKVPYLTLYDPATRMYHLYRLGKDGLVRFRTFGPADPSPEVRRCGTMLLQSGEWPLPEFEPEPKREGPGPHFL